MGKDKETADLQAGFIENSKEFMSPEAEKQRKAAALKALETFEEIGKEVQEQGLDEDEIQDILCEFDQERKNKRKEVLK